MGKYKNEVIEKTKQKKVGKKQSSFPRAEAFNQGKSVNNTGGALGGGASRDVLDKSCYMGDMKAYFDTEVARLKDEYADVLMESIPEGHTMSAEPARIRFIQGNV